MAGITIYEFDALTACPPSAPNASGLRAVPKPVFDWLEAQALAGGTAWLRLMQKGGRRAVQALGGYAGVIRAPGGYQIEVLPKIGRATSGDQADARTRQLFIRMLCCLARFRHIQTESACLKAARMPLLEVFIGEFLRAAERVVKRGLRGDYVARRGNVFALRGKLQMAAHLRRNLCQRDRFFCEFDEFSSDRPENRLLHSALRRTLSWTAWPAHQQLARELCFVFAQIPQSAQPAQDFRRTRLDRSMAHYASALAWARLILQNESPLTGAGGHDAPSLLFPMAEIFEACVARHLKRQLAPPFTLCMQAGSHSLVRHREQGWFRLKPDLLVQQSGENRLVLDTKWKLLDNERSNSEDKYGLSQADFYQLHAYGQTYLKGQGDMALIYPKTDAFRQALPVFEFQPPGLRLWVLPFCLEHQQLILPDCGSLDCFWSRSAPFQFSPKPAPVL